MPNYTSVRFWSKVNKNGPVPSHCPELGQCWTWIPPKHTKGYGLFYSKGNRYAHRYSWELHNGLIPKGLWVLHKCDNPACVRPDHLYLGTNVDNSADMVERDRQTKGEDHPMHKLTEEDILTIRRIYRKGSSTHGARPLGRRYKVWHTIILDIVNMKTWKHV